MFPLFLLDHSSSEAGLKDRSDSGYFDGGFADEDESVCDDRSEAPVVGTVTPFEFDKDSTANKGNLSSACLECVLQTFCLVSNFNIGGNWNILSDRLIT